MYYYGVDAMVQTGDEQSPRGLFNHRPDQLENRRIRIIRAIMRVLIYTHVFPPNVGGVETYARLLSEGLVKQAGLMGTERIEVTVVTQSPAESGYDAQFSFPVVRQPGHFRLLKLIRSATVVQLAGPSLLPMLFALLLRKPFVIEQHGYQAVCPNGLLLYEPTKEVCPGHFIAQRYQKCLSCNQKLLGWRKSLKLLLLTFPRRVLCRQAAMNVAITRHVAKRLELPRSRVVYYGIPDPLTFNSAAPAVLDKHLEPLCFAYVGRLVSEKGLPLLVQAARRLRDQGHNFHLKLVGDGPEREKLEAAVTALGLRQHVTFTGFLSGSKLEEVLIDAVAVVMPSIWEETAGLAAIEQMFRGRLVITSDIGGLGEVVGSTGLKFPAGNTEALTNCMRQVLEKPDIVSEFGQRARLRALNCFGLESMLNEHMGIYRNSCGSRRPCAKRD
jgi:glycogen(starch) synthase